jgi:signal transduction histidine kinase/ligand-binding sensor domain-containing protein
MGMYAGSREFHSHRWAGRFSLLVLLALWLASQIEAQIPSPLPERTLAQWQHKAWTFAGGAPGQVSMLHQSPDGFLWLSAAQSLYRFDGQKFERFIADDGQPIPAAFTMVDAPDGGMWVGLILGGIVYVHGQHVVRYRSDSRTLAGSVYHIAIGSDGRTWAASMGGLYYLDDQHWKKAGNAMGFTSNSATALLLDKNGTLWVAGEKHLFRLSRGATTFVDTGIPLTFTYDLVQAPDGAIWAGQVNHLGPVVSPDGHPYSGPMHFDWDSAGMVFDGDGTLWVSTLGDGLKRVRVGADGNVSSDTVDTYKSSDGLSANYTWPLIKDHEGNFWVGTSAGLDRFRRSALIPAPLPLGAHDFALVDDGQGGIIAGTTNQPPMQWVGNAVRTLQLDTGNATAAVRAAYRDEQGRVWLGSDDGLLLWQNGKLTKAAPMPPIKSGRRDEIEAITSDYNGGAWVALAYEGIWHWREGQWTQLSDAHATAIVSSPDSGLLALAHRNSEVMLQHYENDKLASALDLPLLDVGYPTVLTAHHQHWWFGTALGWGIYDGKTARLVRSRDNHIWGIAAIMETPQGDLWIDAVPGIFHVPASNVQRVLHDPNAMIDTFDRYDYLDGLPGRPSLIRPIPGAILADNGTLWFATSDGVVSLDPKHIPHNTLPPPISVTAVRLDGRSVDLDTGITMQPGVSNLEIDYTALSLTVPERVHFKYKLEGWDQDWQDVGGRRTAYYGRLTPGRYRFLVRASNNDGVWNNEGASIQIIALPAFYQTWWFRSLCALAALAFLWMLYRLRFLYVERNVRTRLEGQHAERERIARELHDTFLQTVQGLVLKLYAVSIKLPEGELRYSITSAVKLADDAASEARDRVQALRASSTVQPNLAESFERVADEYDGHYQPVVHVKEVGRQTCKDPLIIDELYVSGREAIVNALHHSDATLINVLVDNDHTGIRIVISDDGKGIDPKVLAEGGKPGHWGLCGIRERMNRIGGTCHIASDGHAGTTVTLIVDGSQPTRHKLHSHLARKVT